MPVLHSSPLRHSFIDIGQFLAASLPFMVNLKFLTVAFDSYTFLKLSRSEESVEQLRPVMNHAGLMKTVEISKTEVRICADVEEYAYQATSLTRCPTCSISPSSVISSEFRMLVWGAKVATTLDNTLELGLRKATKKDRIPKHCQVKLIYVGH